MEAILPEDDEWFYIVPWELLQNELAPLQGEGKISNLRYIKDTEGKTGCFIVRFFVTDKLEIVDLFNIDDAYFPTKEEKSKKWFKW